MFKKLRRYQAYGRTTHEKLKHTEKSQITPQPTEILVSAFTNPPEYPSALRLDFGAENYDGGWIKLPRNTLEHINTVLSRDTTSKIAVCQHEGVCIDVQPDPSHQHGSRDVRDVVLQLRRIDTHSQAPASEFILGMHDAAGARITLSSTQTQDFIDVIKMRQTTPFENIQQNIHPTVVTPTGEPTSKSTYN